VGFRPTALKPPRFSIPFSQRRTRKISAVSLPRLAIKYSSTRSRPTRNASSIAFRHGMQHKSYNNAVTYYRLAKKGDTATKPLE
jgi:hypothetical protein